MEISDTSSRLEAEEALSAELQKKNKELQVRHAGETEHSCLSALLRSRTLICVPVPLDTPLLHSEMAKTSLRTCSWPDTDLTDSSDVNPSKNV